MSAPARAQAQEVPLLMVKELADKLRRHENYVYRMRAAGFVMPGGTATLDQARLWLMMNPDFRKYPRLQRRRRRQS